MGIHYKKPLRRDINQQPNYATYRDDLKIDFNNACGYCGDSDFRVDRICFHIDHFAPKKRFPGLINTYSNLVYSCRFCNVRKSDHWIGNDPTIPHDGEKGFIDPCSAEYEDHLDRDSSGKIIAKTTLGHYILKRLSLNLLRHELLWNARRAIMLRNEIPQLSQKYIAANLPKNEMYIKLLERFVELTQKIDEYERLANHG